MHRLLEDQIQQYLGSLEALPPEWRRFLVAVSETYEAAERDRQTLVQDQVTNTQALLEANAQMRKAIPDLFFQLDQDSIIRDYKPGSMHDVYVPLLDPIGKPLYSFLPTEVAEQFRTALQQLSLKQPMLSFSHSLVLDGETYFYEVRLVQLSHHQAIAIIRDITLQKRTEAELTAAKETAIREATRSEEANLAKSQFLAKMSHELRTPLNAILGFSQLMNRDPNLNADQKDYLNTINQSGKHLLDVINEILDLAKIEAGRTTLNEQPFHLPRLLNSVRAMLAMKATSKGLEFRLELDPELPVQVEADEQKLRQVLINLLGNAIKFTAQGWICLAVKTLSTSENGRILVQFQIQDTGCGINETETDNLFDPFVQSLKRTDNQEGTGLGLTISQQFVQLMGGMITVQSTVGQGTLFQFTIPLKLVRESTSLAQTPLVIVGLAPDQPNHHILVVEDRKTNRDLLMTLLATVGFTVTAVTQGEEAIAAWQTIQPDFIWMDLQMPILDGLGATQAIRQQERSQGVIHPVPIVVLTASAFVADEAQVLEMGCNGLVRKPYTESIIFETMARHLGVIYTYADEEIPTTSPHLGRSFPSDDPTQNPILNQFQSMPPAWQVQLKQAVYEADGEEIHQLVQQLPPLCGELGTAIVQWLDGFEFETMIAMLDLESESDAE
ncbi:PAS domain-containing sensor histidine kinase [Spirulina major]|uniref:PAS domain-containing sensor histidine kinase n=1 Tax=Spirulina major TaxID=270636 RepID=UPI001115062B|nr:PAS domain-containing sensor histidine kinase [Spirulina major]